MIPSSLGQNMNRQCGVDAGSNVGFAKSVLETLRIDNRYNSNPAGTCAISSIQIPMIPIQVRQSRADGE
jgi:hypothetical protein